jgi:redox-sensing transcriptional repressor
MRTKYRAERIPRATVARMAIYLCCLTQLEQQHELTVSSHALAALIGVTPEQVRQDFSIFGCVGKCGAGYDVATLKTEIETIFGQGVEQWTCCIVGTSGLARALISSDVVQKCGFRYVAAFDMDPHGIRMPIKDIPVYSVSELKMVVRREHIAIGVIAVPASAACRVAKQLCEAGIRGILNFAPQVIRTSEKIPALSVDLSQEFLKLAFYIQSTEQRAREEQAQIEATSHSE